MSEGIHMPLLAGVLSFFLFLKSQLWVDLFHARSMLLTQLSSDTTAQLASMVVAGLGRVVLLLGVVICTLEQLKH